MGENIDQILAEVGDGDEVIVTIISNENDGVASYATGALVYHTATGGLRIDGPPYRPARLASNGTLALFLSDRRVGIPAGVQSFDANAPEEMGVLFLTAAAPLRCQTRAGDDGADADEKPFPRS